MIVPSDKISIFSAAGVFPNPGIVIISPVKSTTNPAPADNRASFMLTVKSVGRPFKSGLSESEYLL